MEDLTDLEQTQLGEQLQKECEELQQLLDHNASSTDPVVLDQTLVGRVSRVDAIQQQQMAKASQAAAELRLKKIRVAMRRHNEGDYGFCLSCDESIGFPRLHVQPECALCLPCQEKLENPD